MCIVVVQKERCGVGMGIHAAYLTEEILYTFPVSNIDNNNICEDIPNLLYNKSTKNLNKRCKLCHQEPHTSRQPLSKE